MVQHVELCDSGHQAVERARTDVRLILMDIQMPDMDGIRPTNSSIAPHQQQTPIIAVTAQCNGRGKKEAWRGMSDYLAKPIEEERLHNLLLRYKHSGPVFSSRVVTPRSQRVVTNATATAAGTTPGSRKKFDLARDMLQCYSISFKFATKLRNLGWLEKTRKAG